MEIEDVPAALQTRLGLEGTSGLLVLLDRSRHEARDDVIIACTDRFNRRLVEETSGLRVQTAQLGATLRQEMAAMGADLRQEMAAMGADLRKEMTAMGGDLRKEMTAMGADLRKEMSAMGGDLRKEMTGVEGRLRQDMTAMEARLNGQIASGRVEFIKWSFAFWMGQVLVNVAILSAAVRLLR